MSLFTGYYIKDRGILRRKNTASSLLLLQRTDWTHRRCDKELEIHRESPTPHAG
jgi:uncharacterized protein YdaU (DUF1376 family)